MNSPVPDTSGGTSGASPRIWWLAAGLVVAAFGANLAWYSTAKKPCPPGWTVIQPPGDVEALAVQGEFIWSGGKEGVVKIDRRSGRVVQKLETEPPLIYVRALLVDEAGTLWIGHQSGLTRCEGPSFRTFTRKDGLPGDWVTSLLLDRDHRLWVGTFTGAARREGEGWRVFKEENGLIDDMVNVMLQDAHGDMWFGSNVAPRGGLSVSVGGQWRHFSVENRLPHNNVTALCSIGDSVVWAATGLLDRGGVAEFTRPPGGTWRCTRTITKADGLAGEKARSLFVDAAGTIWCGSEYDGIAYFKSNRWHVLDELSGLSHSEVRAIVQDTDGTLWLGTGNGITRLNAEALARLP